MKIFLKIKKVKEIQDESEEEGPRRRTKKGRKKGKEPDERTSLR